MSTCFILASMEDRTDALNRCVDCIKSSMYADDDVFLYFQGKSMDGIKDKEFFKEIVADKNPRGIFTPRYELMKRFSRDYDYTIIIDDDLYLYPNTSYENCKTFLEEHENAGCVCLSNYLGKTQNYVVCCSDKMEYYNITGGLVLPKKSIEIILEYFKDKETDYTEDMFWLLLYVKGLDLYKDYSSNAIHRYNYKGKAKNITGYSKMRIEKPYIPILQEYFDDTEYELDVNGNTVRAIKSLRHINQNGLKERRRSLGST